MEKIAISVTSYGQYSTTPIKLCKAAGFDIVQNKSNKRLTSEEVITLADGAVGLIAGTESITEQVLQALPNLKIISRVGVGVDSIDLAKCNQRGIKVKISPCDELFQAVAEHTLMLILQLIKPERNLKDLIVGIIGSRGRIGSVVCTLVRKFGSQVLEYDLCYANNMLDILLENSDIITVHCSGTGCVLGKNELNKMNPQSYIVNTSRKPCVDEEAVYQSLKKGHILGFASDVNFDFPNTFGKIILTNHMASKTREARIAMEALAMDNIIKCV